MIRLASIRDIRRINELLLQVQKVHSDIRPDLFKYIGTKYNDSELEGIIKIVKLQYLFMNQIIR